MGLTTWKTWTVGNGLVLPPTTQHFNFTILAPIKYLSSDCIMTWSVCTLCSFSRCFISRCQICDRTNICWVAIEKSRISHNIWCYFTVIQRILVRSPRCKREVEERVKLYNLRIDQVVIPWDLKYSIWAKITWTIIWNRSLGKTRPRNSRSTSGLGNNPNNTKQVGFWASSSS